jgi:hypothetical protein
MNTIPTAEEFALQDGYDKVIDHVTETRMIEFAKLHVEKALEAASKEAKITESVTFGWKQINKKSILNSYPLENIK